MKRAISFILVFILFSIFMVAARSYASEPAIDFTLNDISGKAVTLSQFKNKQPVILIFWTIWCPFCREQLGVLKEKYAQLKQDGVEVFAVDVGEKQAKVESFVKDRNFPFRVLLDESAGISKSYEVYGVPTYVFIDKTGAIALKNNQFPDYKAVFGIKNPPQNGK
ncbi:MAG: TlpA disulfide reductase family protein [Candidatus Omnitrophica bacterium]|nr:TlpA disulfide reductase family protein [Candidatus Omnitrophota bacterium]